MKRTIAAILLIAIAAALMSGCGTDDVPRMGDGDRFETVSNRGNAWFYRQVIQDRETGVQYLVVVQDKGCGITPLLNADGTPYTGDVG